MSAACVRVRISGLVWLAGCACVRQLWLACCLLQMGIQVVLRGWKALRAGIFVFSPLLVLEERRRSEGLKEELRWPQVAAALLVLG